MSIKTKSTDLRRRMRDALQGGGTQAIEKQKATGKLTARERIIALLCAHNGKEFDFPYIARRLLINGLSIPEILNLAGKKPWEVQHLDTMDLWRFGDYKSYTSLNLLTAIFNIPSPKDDIDGSMVYEIYWLKNDIDRIVAYCQRDTLAVAQLLLRYLGKPIIEDSQVIIT
jgi:uncharacterized protein YprB with RNaseH-like and TPR domain